MADYVAKSLKMPILVDGQYVEKTFEFKDAAARQATVGGTHFWGETTTPLTDGSTATSVQINGTAHVAANGDMVTYLNKEFIYATADLKWHEMGDITDLGDLAVEDTAEIDYTPAFDLVDGGVTLTTDDTKYVATSDTAGGSVVAGSADSLTLNVSGSVLEIGWAAGTPTAVTMPTFTQQDIVTGVTAFANPTVDADPATLTAYPPSGA